jgi:hypothetical protein
VRSVFSMWSATFTDPAMAPVAHQACRVSP